MKTRKRAMPPPPPASVSVKPGEAAIVFDAEGRSIRALIHRQPDDLIASDGEVLAAALMVCNGVGDVPFELRALSWICKALVLVGRANMAELARGLEKTHGVR